MFCTVYLSEYLETPISLGDSYILEPLMSSIRVFSMVSHLLWGFWSVMRAPQTQAFDEFDFLSHARFRFDSFFRTKRLFLLDERANEGGVDSPLAVSGTRDQGPFTPPRGGGSGSYDMSRSNSREHSLVGNSPILGVGSGTGVGNQAVSAAQFMRGTDEPQVFSPMSPGGRKLQEAAEGSSASASGRSSKASQPAAQPLFQITDSTLFKVVLVVIASNLIQTYIQVAFK